MFVLSATKVLLSVDQSEVVTSGSVNVNQVQFIFDEAWDGLDKTALFQAADDSESVILDETGVCNIPWEVLENPRRTLYAGVYGTKDGSVVLPTVWASLGTIKQGTTTPGGDVPPTPDVYSQILSIANEAKEISQEALTTAEDAKVGASGSAVAAQESAEAAEKAANEAADAKADVDAALEDAQQAASDAADAKADVDAALEDAQEAASDAAASAQTAATAATNAEAAKTAIENMTVSAETLEAGQDVTVEKTENEDGTVNLNFGIPEGPPGQDGVQIDDDTVSETSTWSSAKISDALKPSLEEQIAAYYMMRRTGKVYQTKVWKFAANPTSAGEKLRDNAGLVFEPSTDTAEGRDDYLNGSNPLFEWVNVNYVRDADGSPRPIAIEGMESYATTGAADVGTMQMSFWFNVDASDPEYIIYTVSDTPHPELGLEPWPECVRGDGTVLPWCIGSKYISGLASDGLLRSQPGLVPERMMSYQHMITEYQKKGEGYWGAGVVRNTFQIVFNAIKGATKSSQTLFAGTTSYSFQFSASVERATDETYFPITNAQAANVVVGSRVSVGYGAISGDALSNDRGFATMHSYADSAKVLRIEPLDDANMAVYLDIETGFDTTPVVLSDTISAPITMSSMHWESGTTDAVLGHHDGSVVSNTNGKYPYRVQGREYAVGAYMVVSDTAAWLNEDGTRDIYTAKRGDPHISSGNDAIKAAYKLVGTIPVKEGSETAADYWIGDIAVDLETGASLVSAQGASNTQGVGDYYYAGGTGYNTFCEYPIGGNLWYVSAAGASFVDFRNSLGTRNWHYVAGD